MRETLTRWRPFLSSGIRSQGSDGTRRSFNSKGSQPGWDEKCPICRKVRDVVRDLRPGYIFIRCKSCGEYEIEAALSDKFRELHYADPDYRLCRYLGCHTRQRAEVGECAQIRLAEWRDLASKYHNKTGSAQEFVEVPNWWAFGLLAILTVGCWRGAVW